MFTRGHRNPQGLIYIPTWNVIFDIEHGDKPDDGINLLQSGMNYSWKNVGGYHYNNNYPGEANSINSYLLNPNIANDRLVKPWYAWCSAMPSCSSNNADWCTVAPSDGIYYYSSAIPKLQHSILVLTLKKGVCVHPGIYVFRLLPNSNNLIPSTFEIPNPQFIGNNLFSDNSRLRDLAISKDGKSIFVLEVGNSIFYKLMYNHSNLQLYPKSIQ